MKKYILLFAILISGWVSAQSSDSGMAYFDYIRYSSDVKSGIIDRPYMRSMFFKGKTNDEIYKYLRSDGKDDRYIEKYFGITCPPGKTCWEPDFRCQTKIVFQDGWFSDEWIIMALNCKDCDWEIIGKADNITEAKKIRKTLSGGCQYN